MRNSKVRTIKFSSLNQCVLKSNQKFRRLHLRGKEKVGTEWGLLMVGYDFRQLARLAK